MHTLILDYVVGELAAHGAPKQAAVGASSESASLRRLQLQLCRRSNTRPGVVREAPRALEELGSEEEEVDDPFQMDLELDNLGGGGALHAQPEPAYRRHAYGR